jgi:hypothetical protein
LQRHFRYEPLASTEYTIYLRATVGSILEQQHFLFSFDEASSPWGDTKVGNVPLFEQFPELLFRPHTLTQSIQLGQTMLTKALYGPTAPITGGLEVTVPK